MEVALEFVSSVYDKRRMPMFLENVAPDAEVHADFLDVLDSFQRREDGTEVLADTVKELTGGHHVHLIATQSPQHSQLSLLTHELFIICMQGGAHRDAYC